MAGGFGEAAAAASFLSLTIQVFDGCVKGFILLSDAQGFGSMAEILVCQLEWEHYRLNNWATIVGLHKDPPELIIPNAPLVQKTLVSLEQLLMNTEILSRDYGLDIEVTNEEVKELSASRRFLGKVIDRTKPQFLNNTAKVYQRRNNTWKKLKWSAVDGNKFRLLLKDIRYFNKKLESLLHPADQRLNTQIYDQVLRLAIAQTPDRRSIEAIEAISGPVDSVDHAIASSAKLRQKGLSLDLIKPAIINDAHVNGHTTTASSTVGSQPKVLMIKGAKTMRKDLALLSCQGNRRQDIVREMATFDGKTVVVEWKDVAEVLEPRLKYRIANVASFLADMRDPAFHSLICFGYIRVSTGRYAYLFEPPATLQSMCKIETLGDLLQHWNLCPGINTRIAIALALAETVLQLHTTGWLHKSIRPNNLMFFHPDLEGWYHHQDSWKVYLGGYESARADNPLETTEEPSNSDLSELYRHPESLGQGRSSYNKRFDQHSLGCVLIELGLWKSLPDLLWDHVVKEAIAPNASGGNPATNRNAKGANFDPAQKHALLEKKASLLSSRSHGSLLADLEHKMGATYANLAHSCLYSDADNTDSIHESDLSLVLQQNIVNALKKLNDIL
ncbi:MAG: hypothetical protein Q9167_003702 [Letrouitia subvulpina]